MNERRAEWEKTKLRRFVMTLHRDNDRDILEWMEKQPNVRKYLMDLVRKDMND